MDVHNLFEINYSIYVIGRPELKAVQFLIMFPGILKPLVKNILRDGQYRIKCLLMQLKNVLIFLCIAG